MDKINYGYKSDDLINLAKFVNGNRNLPLNKIFTEFSVVTGKAKGTIRNLYYNLAKTSVNDNEFCQKYLDGEPIKVSKIEEFSKKSEQELVENILKGVKNGESVRSVVLRLASNDFKLALRYQNKYRNIVKRNPTLINAKLNELKLEGSKNQQKEVMVTKKELIDTIPDYLMAKLKREINGLVDKISKSCKNENDYLKKRVAYLEMENLRLSNLLYGSRKKNELKEYFVDKGQGLLN